jgi:hypothetical protein
MPGYPTLSTRVIGQAEKTLNAILGRQLAGSGLTEPQWVILTLAVTSGGRVDRDQFTRTVAGALKISEADAQAHIVGMLAAQRLEITGADSAVTVTGAAEQLHGQVVGGPRPHHHHRTGQRRTGPLTILGHRKSVRSRPGEETAGRGAG